MTTYISEVAFSGIRATVTSTDTGGSGVNYAECKYVFTNSSSLIGTGENSYTGGNITSASQVIEDLMPNGNWYLHVLLVDYGGNRKEVVSRNYIAVSNSSALEYTYTGEVQDILLPAGRYKIECWGAQGGIGYINHSARANPGKGSYVSGIIALVESTDLFLYVGGKRW